MDASAPTVQDQAAVPAGRSWNVPIPVRLSVRDGQLHAEGARTRTGTMGLLETRGGRSVVRLDPVAFFIPESVVDPSIRQAGEELWVEVTVPRRGSPRPIRLGVKRDGVLTPVVL